MTKEEVLEFLKEENPEAMLFENPSFEKAIIIIRPYGAEEIPLELQEVATKVVGWNTACIVDAILLSINGEDYEFLM